jgi:DNA-binding LytR/AlgR family response regulator
MVPVSKISCIEAFDYYIKIHYESQYTLTRIPLKNILQRLPVEKFIRIHRSYVINIYHIDSIEKRKKGEFVVKLKSGSEVRVSETYKKNLLNKFKTD